MKKLFAIILLLIPSLCLGGIQDHPRFAELQSMVDSLITTIKNNQATYYAVHKQYFQGLQIPVKSEVVCDGMTVVGLCIQWNSEYRVNKVISALEQYGVYAGDIVLTDKEINKVRERSMYYPDAPLDIGSPCKSGEDFSVLVVESGNTVYKNTWHEWPIR